MALKDHGYFTGVVGKWHLGAPRLIYPGDASPHYQDYEFLERQNNLTLQHCKDFGFDVAERVYRSNVGAVEVNNDIPWELKFHNLEWVTGGATSFLDQVAYPPPPPPRVLPLSACPPHFATDVVSESSRRKPRTNHGSCTIHSPRRTGRPLGSA